MSSSSSASLADAKLDLWNVDMMIFATGTRSYEISGLFLSANKQQIHLIWHAGNQTAQNKSYLPLYDSVFCGKFKTITLSIPLGYIPLKNKIPIQNFSCLCKEIYAIFTLSKFKC